MTDAHCHISANDPSVREFLVGRDFIGIHPWDAVSSSPQALEDVRERLAGSASIGVGEIGLDRLHERDIPPKMQELFDSQLALAVEFDRPVVLHGAKCWGRVVEAVKRLPRKNGRLSFLFHGFSRSGGLIPEIARLGGFISVGPAVLNDHAVNYRKLVCDIPLGQLLVETDRTDASDVPPVRDVLSALAAIRKESCDFLERVTDENAERFFGSGGGEVQGEIRL